MQTWHVCENLRQQPIQAVMVQSGSKCVPCELSFDRGTLRSNFFCDRVRMEITQFFW